MRCAGSGDGVETAETAGEEPGVCTGVQATEEGAQREVGATARFSGGTSAPSAWAECSSGPYLKY